MYITVGCTSLHLRSKIPAKIRTLNSQLSTLNYQLSTINYDVVPNGVKIEK
ncbi:MAG: hypothetical protein LBE12_18795 [Planctomycetaceae bacterium]|jgi:hypothetical protein|nr:hypothetical protein [Planctomycetaceae bacterium]